MQKGIFSNAEGHVLKYRRACSQIQKGPFFFFNTHALHSCGAKQIYIKIKYSSPSHAFHSPHPFPFHPHSTPFPSPAHSPLSVTPRTCSSVTLSLLAYNLFSRPLLNPSTYNVTHRTCSSVTLSPLAYNLLTRLPVNSSTYNVTHRTCSSVTLSPLATNLFPCPLLNPSTYNVTLRTCSPVTLSPLAYNLLTRLPINSSTCPLLSELVYLLPCLLIQLTCSLVHSLIRLLINYFYHLTFLSVLVQNTATLILPFLSPTSTVKKITISKTSH